MSSAGHENTKIYYYQLPTTAVFDPWLSSVIVAVQNKMGLVYSLVCEVLTTALIYISMTKQDDFLYRVPCGFQLHSE